MLFDSRSRAPLQSRFQKTFPILALPLTFVLAFGIRYADAEEDFVIKVLAPARVSEEEVLDRVTSAFGQALFSGETLPESVYSALRSVSHPLPDAVYEKLRPHWEKSTIRPRFRARYVVSPGLVNLMTGGSAIAITWYDIVLFREPVTDHPASLALVTHELVHVAQYERLGLHRFLSDYAAESLYHGAENSFEREAGQAEARMFHALIEGR